MGWNTRNCLLSPESRLLSSAVQKCEHRDLGRIIFSMLRKATASRFGLRAMRLLRRICVCTLDVNGILKDAHHSIPYVSEPECATPSAIYIQLHSYVYEIAYRNRWNAWCLGMAPCPERSRRQPAGLRTDCGRTLSISVPLSA